MEDKHSNCNGFRCVLCGTVAKSRNSLHSHMSRQHRGISTKDLPLLPMPAPWSPEMAAKYIQLVGGVGEVVRQNYRRTDRDGREIPSGGPGSDASTPTPSGQENGTLSPFMKDPDNNKDRRPFDAITRHLELSNYGVKPPAATNILDTYLQMFRASGVDLSQAPPDKAWDDPRLIHPGNYRGVLDLTRNTMSPPKYDDDDTRASDNFTDEEDNSGGGNDNGTDSGNGGGVNSSETIPVSESGVGTITIKDFKNKMGIEQERQNGGVTGTRNRHSIVTIPPNSGKGSDAED